MKKNIIELEKELKEITGEDTLPKGELSNKTNKKSFNASKFTKLANEVKKIFTEDGTYTNPAIKS